MPQTLPHEGLFDQAEPNGLARQGNLNEDDLMRMPPLLQSGPAGDGRSRGQRLATPHTHRRWRHRSLRSCHALSADRPLCPGTPLRPLRPGAR